MKQTRDEIGYLRKELETEKQTNNRLRQKLKKKKQQIQTMKESGDYYETANDNESYDNTSINSSTNQHAFANPFADTINMGVIHENTDINSNHNMVNAPLNSQNSNNRNNNNMQQQRRKQKMKRKHSIDSDDSDVSSVSAQTGWCIKTSGGFRLKCPW